MWLVPVGKSTKTSQSNLVGSIWKPQPASNWDYFNFWVEGLCGKFEGAQVSVCGKLALESWIKSLKPGVSAAEPLLVWSCRSLLARTRRTCSWRRGRRPCAKPRRRNTSSRCQCPAFSTLTSFQRRCATEGGSEQRVQSSSEEGKVKREQGRFLLMNCFLFKCASVCVFWKENEGPESGPQHSVVRRPNQCQYVNENRPPQPWRRFFFFFPTNLFYTKFLCVCVCKMPCFVNFCWLKLCVWPYGSFTLAWRIQGYF